MAINPDMFEPGFQGRMQELINICRATPLVYTHVVHWCIQTWYIYIPCCVLTYVYTGVYTYHAVQYAGIYTCHHVVHC